MDSNKDTERGEKRGILATGRAKDLEKTKDADAESDRAADCGTDSADDDGDDADGGRGD